MSERADIGECMRAIDSLLPVLNFGGTMPSYLRKPYLIFLSLFSQSFGGALGATKLLENATQTAIEKRKQEIVENKDNRRDVLRKMLEINADRGEKIDFTHGDILVESYSAM